MPAVINANDGEKALELVRTKYGNLQLEEILGKDPSVLLAVSAAGAVALKQSRD